MKLAKFSIFLGAFIFTSLAVLAMIFLNDVTNFFQNISNGSKELEPFHHLFGYRFHFHSSSIANNPLLLRVIIAVIWLVGSAVLFLPPASRISRIEKNDTDQRGLLVFYGIVYLLLFGVVPGLLLLVGANSDVQNNRDNNNYQEETNFRNEELPLNEEVPFRDERGYFEAPVTTGYERRDNKDNYRTTNDERGDLSSRVRSLEQELRDSEDRERRNTKRVLEDIESVERSSRRKIRDLEDEIENLRRRVK